MNLPSTDSKTSPPPCLVTCTACPPSAGTFQTCESPLRFEVKYTHRPSRDQLGKPSKAGSDVRRRGLPPSALLMKISWSPSMPESKTIHRPSGDQRGVAVCAPPKLVSRSGLAPSLSHSQSSRLPVRSET